MTDHSTDTDDFATRFGKILLLAAWVVGLALLALFFERLIEGQHNPNPDPAIALGVDGGMEVVLERNRLGHYVAAGTINDVPVVFLLDTGATSVALSRALAERLDVPLRAGGLSQTANGRVPTWTTRLERVDLGGLVERNVPAAVLPNMSDSEVLLGMSYLKRFEMLQRGSTLTLRRPPLAD